MLYPKSTFFKVIRSFVYIMLLAASNCNVASTCSHGEICSSYLDITMDMISKAKQSIPICPNCPKTETKPVDCADVLKMGHSMSGIYEIWPMNRMTEKKFLNVYCDMETDGGGWTVFQRRGDFHSPMDYFYKDWKSYKEGFGNLEKDFWLGNDNLYSLTNQKLYSARFDLKDIEQDKEFAVYDTFWIDDENYKYTLHISGYSGNAGNSMETHNNRTFATFDRDNANLCSTAFKGAWWYSNCHHANLNGLYRKGKHSTHDGTTWVTFKGLEESLEWTEIKIRPKQFRAASS